MGFFDEFLNLFENENKVYSFTIMILGTTGIVIEGYKKLKSISSCMIELDTYENSKIVIQGKKLKIKKLEPGQVVLEGEFLNLELKEDCV